MKKIYSAAIIGCGRIASTFDDDALRDRPWTHAGAYEAVKQISIAAAADVEKKQLEAFGKKWDCTNLFPDYREMLDKIHPDIVSICVPTKLHYEPVIAAAQSGAKAIFCEKPIAATLSEADKMLETCRKTGTKLVINHTRRWDSNYTFPKKLIDLGEIGEIHSITGYCPNTLTESGSHMFDMLLYYGGAVDYICARSDSAIDSKQHVKESGADGFIVFKSGAVGFYAGGNIKDYLIFEIDIIGSKGRIRIADNGFNVEFFKPAKSRHYGEYRELIQQDNRLPVRQNRMIAAVQDIVKCIEQGGESASSGEEGRAALELITAFKISISKKGEKISLPLKDREVSVIG